RLGLLDSAAAQTIRGTGRRGAPVLSSAVKQLNAGRLAEVAASPAAPASGVKDKTKSSGETSRKGLVPGTDEYNDAASNPQKIIYEALQAMFPGRVDWEVQGLIPGRKFRADIKIGRVVIEMDGFAFHKTKQAFQNDRDRQNLYVAHGYLPLRCYAAQAFRPELQSEFLEVVRRTLQLADELGQPCR
ncbi:hypothetical protein N5C54_25090, partial [Pseudomonas chengduensis]|uniref:hypothetical protein n=1 Tax=Pseudomonas sp. o96-267 TaxID=2479853 RepID=UPI001C49A2A0